jgi:predicted deacetylase
MSATTKRRRGAIAVAIHDVEPATFERCALIRDWLGDHGIDRVTLLVVPAPDLHPFFQRRPDLAAWLQDCRDAGDSIAQHGLQGPKTGLPEFARMDPSAADSGIAAGRRVLELAGIAPRGYVAPGYAYGPEPRRELAHRFEWWATLLRLERCDRSRVAPVLSLRHSALGIRAGALVAGGLLRLDLHPADFDRPRRVLALESVLSASRRTAVGYDDVW